MFKSKKELVDKEILKDEMKNAEVTNSDSDENPENTEENQPTNGEKGRLKKLEKETERLKDQLLRKAAEFENYKRRTDSEISNIYRHATEGLITDLLPVLDDFERMMKAWNEKHEVETLKKGAGLVYEKFRKVLEKQGWKEIKSVGKPFDVNLHDAVMQTESDKVEPDTIIDEVEKGYYLKDKVLRHGKVIVSKKSE